MELITDNEVMFGIYTDDMDFDPDEPEDPEYEQACTKTGGRAQGRSFLLKY